MKITNNIIAHRGIHDNKTIPENSLLAFKTALKYNYPIELDVQLTKDDVLVVFHDFDLKRMANINSLIRETTYSDLQKIKLLTTNETIPTLAEVLKLIDSKVLLDIEIKNTKQVKKTCEILINNLKNYHNFILKSFNPKIVRYLKKHYPHLEVGFLITNNYKNSLYKKLLTSKFIQKYSHTDFLAIDKALLNNKRFMNQNKNEKLLIWTIKSKDELTNTDYTYICNNLPFK